MKRPFQIRKITNYSNYLTFWLDGNLDCKDKTVNYITVYNKAPFNGYKVRDDIVIDTATVAGHPQGAVFGEETISKSSF